MEGLAPPLKLTLMLRMGLERGEPIRKILKDYIQSDSDALTDSVVQWLSLKDQGIDGSKVENKMKSPYRRILFQLLEKGFRGEGLLPQLILIEEELKEACKEEIDRKVALLPLKALIPLLFFQFPALLLLLFMPLLRQLTQSL